MNSSVGNFSTGVAISILSEFDSIKIGFYSTSDRLLNVTKYSALEYRIIDACV